LFAVSVPSELNIQKLASMIGTSRHVVYEYLEYLKDARIFNIVRMEGSGYRILNKTEKIYLENTNLAYILSNNVNPGTIREAFFVNQILNNYTMNRNLVDSAITLSKSGDFLVEDKFTFEIGGKGKTNKQIRSLSDAYIASDGIEYGFGEKIPLWLFGFLY